MDTDIRLEELNTIEAIYQDLAKIDSKHFSGSVAVPIELENNVSVRLPSQNAATLTASVSYLPPITLRFGLPEGYPYEIPPSVDIECPLLDKIKIDTIQSEISLIWQDLKVQTLFTIIDHLQQLADRLSHELPEIGVDCNGNQTLYEQISTHNEKKKQEAFENATFTCEICQRDLKGSKCIEFSNCHHVFCRVCLKDFFVSLIETGEVEKIHCPDFECGKKAFSARERFLRLDHLDKFNFEDFKTQIMTPPIRLGVLHSILGTDPEGLRLYEKYTMIFTDHQHVLITRLFPMRLVSCPRKNCTGSIFRENTQDRLVVCRVCEYAFCNICRKSYHSSSIDCSRNRSDNKLYHGIAVDDIEIWINEGKSTSAGNEIRCRYGHDLLQKVADEYTMDRLFDQMLQEESHEFSRCPTCDIVVQRSEGCNKMRCSHCYTFFCHLCSCYLDQDHPYDHFKEKGSACYNKLFQGMPGTEDMD